MLRDPLGTMLHHAAAGSERIRKLNAEEVAQVAEERREKARKIREERARKKNGPAVGCLLGDATWIGPKPKG